MKNNLKKCVKLGKIILVFLISFSQMNFPLSVLAEELTNNNIDEVGNTTYEENNETNEIKDDNKETLEETENNESSETTEDNKETETEVPSETTEEEPNLNTPDETKEEELGNETEETSTFKLYVNDKLLEENRYEVSETDGNVLNIKWTENDLELGNDTFDLSNKIYGTYTIKITEEVSLDIVYSGNNYEIINKYIKEESRVTFKNNMYVIRASQEKMGLQDLLDNFSNKLSEDYDAYLITSCLMSSNGCGQISSNNWYLIIGSKQYSGVSSGYPIVVKGDIDSNGILDNNDKIALMASGMLFNQEELTASELELYDVNEDGKFDILDIASPVYTTGVWTNEVETHDELKVSLSSDEEVTVGDKITLNFDISGFDKDTLTALAGTLNYDEELLRIYDIEIDSTATSGYFDEKNLAYTFDNYDGKSENALMSITFESLEVGNTNIILSNIQASNGALFSLDGETILQNITIVNDAKGGDVAPIEPKEEEQPAVAVVETNTNVNNESYTYRTVANTTSRLSDDNYIKELTISGYPIDFDMYKYEYAIKVKNSVNSLDLNVVLHSSLASYKIEGNEKFKVGDNTVTIKVTAEDGSTRDYKIKVTKAKKVTTEDEEEEETSKSSKAIIIVLIVLVIIGLIYVIFKDDEEDKNA